MTTIPRVIKKEVGHQGRAYWVAYGIATYAVEGLAQIWADEYKTNSPIRINTIDPGFGDGLFLRTPEAFKKILADLPAETSRCKAQKYIAIAALYGHIDLLPVCIGNFSQYLKVEGLKAAENLHKALLRRRGITGFMLCVTNRILRHVWCSNNYIKTYIMY